MVADSSLNEGTFGFIDRVTDLVRDLAGEDGIERFKQILHECDGERPLVTKEPRVIKKEKNKQIKKEFNGANYEDLARKYNMKERHIRRIVHDSL